MAIKQAEHLWLFSYGTLRDARVQRAVFGRTLAGEPDSLRGWRSDTIAIGDADVAALSGLEVHSILRASHDPADVIAGTALAITPADLPRADAYETDAYRRIAVTLASGRRAFVYVGE